MNLTNKLTVTMKDAYPVTTIYSSRPSYEDSPWLAAEEHQLNFLSARELHIAELPVIVHEASITDKLATLYQLVDRTVPSNVHTFTDRQSYESLLTQLTHDGQNTIQFQYIHDDSILDPSHYTIDKQIFIDLNNKSKIHQFVDPKHLPKRLIIPHHTLEETLKTWNYPFVIKPGDERPTAGGYGVMICYNDEDLYDAKQRIEACSTESDLLIIEQFITPVENYCIQFATTDDGQITYLGAAKQIIDDHGFYKGNESIETIDQDIIDIGYDIMKKGVEYGFFGIAGFDVLVDESNNAYVIDLNFRVNGSTALLLLKEQLNSNYQKFINYFSPGNNEQFYQLIKRYVEAGHLFPLSYYDGDWYKGEYVQSRFGAIWTGESKAFIKHIEAQFKDELNNIKEASNFD
ncbi:L-aspartate--L-methionine ligase LdmS [Abyssicoccus albus]|uniref:ATP-grasp domain-containing protein n=1 Tax=Abyssicoccus albus TaxID=1817405 RepID=A0A3N5BG34_9BACL|nr:ATP-grasp domain-containing protein [Abyssicoccus albus]RPF56694.1 ATP-grasp domain-containing protein [Abyssicoccus albus]